MSDLRELYQDVILDHGKNPRNYRKIEDADRRAEGYNPLCGDQFTVWVRLDGDVLRDVSFEGAGCAISKASASLMTTALKGRSRDEVETLFERFQKMVTGRLEGDPADLGKLSVLSGVSEFPVRVKCATLPWHTLRAALRGQTDAVSTE